MVHLASIPKEDDAVQEFARHLESLRIDGSSEPETFTTTVYGSRFAASDLPKFEMPECEMPKDFAYRLIKDDLTLDKNPILKYSPRASIELTTKQTSNCES
jgi:glutamate decarboxylase